MESPINAQRGQQQLPQPQRFPYSTQPALQHDSHESDACTTPITRPHLPGLQPPHFLAKPVSPADGPAISTAIRTWSFSTPDEQVSSYAGTGTKNVLHVADFTATAVRVDNRPDAGESVCVSGDDDAGDGRASQL